MIYLQFSSQIIDSNVELVNLNKTVLECDVTLKDCERFFLFSLIKTTKRF